MLNAKARVAREASAAARIGLRVKQSADDRGRTVPLLDLAELIVAVGRMRDHVVPHIYLLLLLLYSRRYGHSLDPSALVDGCVKILAWGMHHIG